MGDLNDGTNFMCHDQSKKLIYGEKKAMFLKILGIKSQTEIDKTLTTSNR